MGDAILERTKKSEKTSQFSGEWKDLMTTILKETNIFREYNKSCVQDANYRCSHIIINERHSKAKKFDKTVEQIFSQDLMALHRPHEAFFILHEEQSISPGIKVRDYLTRDENENFPIPKIVKLVEARKIIRQERMEKLAEEKEKKVLRDSICQLQKTFLERKNKSKMPLLEFERRKRIARGSTGKAGTFECKTLTELHDFDHFLKDINHSDLSTCFFDKSHHSDHTRLAKDLKAISSMRGDKHCETSAFIDTKIREGNRDEDNNYLSKHINSVVIENEKKLNIIQDIGDETNSLISPREQKNEIKDENLSLKLAQRNVEISGSDFSEKLKRLKMTFQRRNLMHHWNAWKKFNSLKKLDRQKLDRQNKIDTFLKRLTDKKDEICHSNRQRSTAKKDIDQKHLPLHKGKPKLNRFSDNDRKISVNHMHRNRNLNLEKIENDINKSNEEMYENLRKSFKNFNPKLRPKVKVLTMLSNFRKGKYDKANKKIKIKYPVPKILPLIENRSKERRKRWEDIANKKKKLQEEKLKMEKDIAEENRKIEEMLKKKHIEKLREKRRLEKEAAERQRERQQRLRMAKNYYTTYLIRAIGFRPWKMLVKIRCNQLQAAVCHYQYLILKSFWWNWKKYVEQNSNKRNERGIEFHNKLLLRHSFRLWMAECDESKKKFQVAIDWADAKLVENAFGIWLINFQTERWNTIRSEQLATSSFERKLKNNSFKNWRKFPKIIRNEREKEMRKQLWRRKVQELLPDFQPNAFSYEAA